MDPFINFLKDRSLPNEWANAHKLKIKASRFCLIDGQIYRKSYRGPYLLCVGPSKAEHIMTAIHDGECGNCFRKRSMVHKILMQGYYWISMHKDAIANIHKYNKCQRFASVTHQPPSNLTTISSPWPFAQ